MSYAFSSMKLLGSRWAWHVMTLVILMGTVSRQRMNLGMAIYLTFIELLPNEGYWSRDARADLVVGLGLTGPLVGTMLVGCLTDVFTCTQSPTERKLDHETHLFNRCLSPWHGTVSCHSTEHSVLLFKQ